MQKKNHKLLKTIVISAIVMLLLLLLIFSEDIIKFQNNNKLNIAESIDNIDTTVEPNIPKLSAGMIPIKQDGENWVITIKEDRDWYDYSSGKPAYIMLNDGTYQSELIPDMNGKKLASDVVVNGAPVVPPDQFGTIFMWIPRFAINDETNDVKYVKDTQEAEDGWTIPELFMYKQSLETSPDFFLTGVWVEKEINTEYANVITEMNKEESMYGFIANTKATQITTDDINSIQTFVGAASRNVINLRNMSI